MRSLFFNRAERKYSFNTENQRHNELLLFKWSDPQKYSFKWVTQRAITSATLNLRRESWFWGTRDCFKKPTMVTVFERRGVSGPFYFYGTRPGAATDWFKLGADDATQQLEKLTLPATPWSSCDSTAKQRPQLETVWRTSNRRGRWFRRFFCKNTGLGKVSLPDPSFPRPKSNC